MKSIYVKHLQEITNIKFTQREIDIITCIYHGKTAKGIASFLVTSHRTVESHINNIRNKIHCSSKNGIIEFIERSNKIPYIMQYYFYLLVQNAFKKQLQKIGILIGNKKKVYYIGFNKINYKGKKLFLQLKQSLEIANIILLEKDNEYKMIENFVQPTNTLDQIFLTANNNIVISEKNHINCINFGDEENYYFSIFALLKKIINKPELEEIIKEFQDKYQTLHPPLETKNIKLVYNTHQSQKSVFKNNYFHTTCSIINILFFIFNLYFIRYYFLFFVN